MTSGDKLTLADILRGLVSLLEDGVANLVVIGCAALGVALCLFAAYRLYTTAIDDRATGNDFRMSTGAILAFVLGAGLTIVSVIAARLSTLFTGT